MNKRFTVTTNHTGCILINDTTKKTGEPGHVVAQFFQDRTQAGKAEMLAEVCADFLDAEAARRAGASKT